MPRSQGKREDDIETADGSTSGDDSPASEDSTAPAELDEHGNPKKVPTAPTEPVAETFWQTICKVMPWAFGTALAIVGGTLAIAVVLPKLAALATAWGLTAKAMVAWGYIKAAFVCLFHCAEYLFNLLISLQGQVLLGMFTFTADLGAVAGIVAGSIMTLIELTIVTLTLGVIGRSITNGICYLFGLNKPKDGEKPGAGAGAGADPDPEMGLQDRDPDSDTVDGCEGGRVIPFPSPAPETDRIRPTR